METTTHTAPHVDLDRLVRLSGRGATNTKMNEPKLKLTLKPCGDCWLHIDAPSGLKASINLGQRGDMNDQTIVGRTIREVAALHEDKPTIPEPNLLLTSTSAEYDAD